MRAEFLWHRPGHGDQRFREFHSCRRWHRNLGLSGLGRSRLGARPNRHCQHRSHASLHFRLERSARPSERRSRGRGMTSITLDRIAHSYGGKPRLESDYQLKPIQHVWEQGFAYALLGPSGCGKTTLLNIISGLVIPSEGRLLFGDKDVTHLPTEQRNIAQVFQFPVIYDTMTVAENLAFPLKNRRMERAAIKARVAEIADLLDLTNDLPRRARALTVEAKQKVSLGRGLVRSDVSAVLFDEPLTVIDPALKWELRSKLKSVHRALDLLMIYVTHDQVEALTFADEVVVMKDGRVLQVASPAQLFERPEHTFVGYFIGSPGMNLIAAEVDGHVARVAGQTIELGARYPRLGAG